MAITRTGLSAREVRAAARAAGRERHVGRLLKRLGSRPPGPPRQPPRRGLHLRRRLRPQRATGAALVMPSSNTEAMNLKLEEISRNRHPRRPWRARAAAEHPPGLPAALCARAEPDRLASITRRNITGSASATPWGAAAGREKKGDQPVGRSPSRRSLSLSQSPFSVSAPFSGRALNQKAHLAIACTRWALLSSSVAPAGVPQNEL